MNIKLATLLSVSAPAARGRQADGAADAAPHIAAVAGVLFCASHLSSAHIQIQDGACEFVLSSFFTAASLASSDFEDRKAIPRPLCLHQTNLHLQARLLLSNFLNQDQALLTRGIQKPRQKYGVSALSCTGRGFGTS